MSEKKQTDLASDTHEKRVQYPRYLLWFLGLIILAYNIFVYGASFGLGRGVFHVFLTLAVFISLPVQRRSFVAHILVVISSAAALLVGFRANGFVQWFDMAIAHLGLLGLFLISALPQINWKIWSLMQNVARFFGWSAFQWLNILGVLGKNTVSEGKVISTTVSSFTKTLAALKTAVIALIVLFIFASLLSSADPIFSRIIDRVLSESFGRFFKSVFLAGGVAILLSIALQPKEDRDPNIRFLSVTDILVTVIGLILLFGVFLTVQFQYLFASHEVFQSFGITYSEYVRKGFFELLVATSIGAVISYIIILKQRASQTRNSLLHHVSIGLLIEFFLLLASAYRRDLMYIEIYGLTRARIIGEIFLYWLAGGILLLYIHSIWSKFKEQYVVAGIGVLSLCAFVYLNVTNMDMKIVQFSPIRNNQKDLFYIANLSEDVSDGWVDLISQALMRFGTLKDRSPLSEKDMTDLAHIKLSLIALRAKRDKLEKEFAPIDEVNKKYLNGDMVNNVSLKKKFEKQLSRDRAWQAYNWSENEAWKKMKSQGKLFFEDLDYLLIEIGRFQVGHQINLYHKERWFLYDYNYPFVDIVDYIPDSSDFYGSHQLQRDQVRYNSPQTFTPTATPGNETLYR